jgi:hypothetical protein
MQSRKTDLLDGRLISFAVFPRGLLIQSRDCQCCALSSSELILRDCRFRFAQTSSQRAPLQMPGLPMLRIVILGIDPYPKPFKQTRSVCLAFLILASLHKRACDAALNEKSLSLCDRLCRAYGIRTRITSVKGR